MRMPLGLLFGISVLAAGAAGTAGAAIINVPGDQPSIAAAVAAASNGDTILIAKGRWQEAMTTTKELNFRGESGTIWDGYFGATHNGQLNATANNVTVQGIEFQNGSVPIAITGDDAQVTGCSLRGSTDGVWVDGSRAQVSKNRFYGQQGSNYTIEIHGPDSVVEKNEILDNDYAGIFVDAESAGTATVARNVQDTSQDLLTITVYNASAPLITKNKLLHGYQTGSCIDVVNCDNAEISGNRLMNINYRVVSGISVVGNNARIYKNVLDNLQISSGDHTAISVTGNDADASRNTIVSCCGGANFDTWGILIQGSGAGVMKNKISHLGGGGGGCTGIQVSGTACEVSKNKLDHFNDMYTDGIYIVGNNSVVNKNTLTNLLNGYSIEVLSDDFSVSNNTIKNGAYGCQAINTFGSATGPGTALIEGNSISNLGYDAVTHFGNGVAIQHNTLRHIAGTGVYVGGNNNSLLQNEIRDTQNDCYRIDGAGNTLDRCSAKNSARDGFDITFGAGNTLNQCEAKGCVAEGLDNGGTATVATNCVLKGSRIDYAGAGNMANDAGTTYKTGGPGTNAEID